LVSNDFLWINILNFFGSPMQEQTGDNVHKIRNFLNDQGFQLEEKGDGLNVTIDSGHLINLYALQRDSDYFWASFETRVADQKKRQLEVKKVKDILATGLLGLAGVDEFKQTQETDGRFVYVADVELDQSLTYLGAITMDEDAVIGDYSPEMQDIEAGDIAKSLEVKEIEPKSKDKPIEVQDIEVVEDDVDLTDVAEINATSSPIEEAMGQLETIDAKMLRQSLDMMSLKRSSNIRLALTRVFRAAGDIEEFRQSIKNEAKKIISDDDQKELRVVEAVSVSGFLGPIVKLLCEEVF
jgi:hypothetical protein